MPRLRAAGPVLLLVAALAGSACGGPGARSPEEPVAAAPPVAPPRIDPAPVATTAAVEPASGGGGPLARILGVDGVADGFFDGRLDTQLPHALAVAADELAAAPPSAGADRMQAEQELARRQMVVIGLAQLVLAHPEQRDAFLPAIHRAAAALVTEETLAFTTRAWAGERGLGSLAGPHGHAYLGYLAMALGFEAAVDPGSPRLPLARALADALARRLDAARFGVIETYPGETYPPDVAVVLGGIGLCDRATGDRHAATLARAVAAMRSRFVDAGSGYLVQKVDAATGAWKDAPRGSGTALAAFALAFVDAGAARALDGALAQAGRVGILGLGGVKEYAPGTSGPGDADSGPMVFGMSVAATGFALASARIQGDHERFRDIVRSVELFGAPRREGALRRYTGAGPLGHAILFAMMTAGPLAARP